MSDWGVATLGLGGSLFGLGLLTVLVTEGPRGIVSALRYERRPATPDEPWAGRLALQVGQAIAGVGLVAIVLSWMGW